MIRSCSAIFVLVLIGLVPSAGQAASAATDASAITASASDDGYRLGTGDKVRVIVFGTDSLGGEFIIANNGRVALPLIGEVAAAGLTPTQLQLEITTALSDGYLKAPRVSVEILNYRPFYILGEVNKPGEYPYAKGLTILAAVAQAEGFTYRAGTKKALVRHTGQPDDTEEKLSANTPVLPGDVIRIKERWF